MAERTGGQIKAETAPVLTQRQLELYQAFLELSTDRQIGMGEGPIPWSSVVAYADRYFWDADELLYVIRQLDTEYMKHQQRKVQNANQSSVPTRRA